MNMNSRVDLLMKLYDKIKREVQRTVPWRIKARVTEETQADREGIAGCRDWKAATVATGFSEKKYVKKVNK